MTGEDKPKSNVVHVAGAPVDGEQSCTRCGFLITPAGLSFFAEGALIRRMEWSNFAGSAVEDSANVAEMCVGKEVGA